MTPRNVNSLSENHRHRLFFVLIRVKKIVQSATPAEIQRKREHQNSSKKMRTNDIAFALRNPATSAPDESVLTVVEIHPVSDDDEYPSSAATQQSKQQQQSHNEPMQKQLSASQNDEAVFFASLEHDAQGKFDAIKNPPRLVAATSTTLLSTQAASAAAATHGATQLRREDSDLSNEANDDLTTHSGRLHSLARQYRVALARRNKGAEPVERFCRCLSIVDDFLKEKVTESFRQRVLPTKPLLQGDAGRDLREIEEKKFVNAMLMQDLQSCDDLRASISSASGARNERFERELRNMLATRF